MFTDRDVEVTDSLVHFTPHFCDSLDVVYDIASVLYGVVACGQYRLDESERIREGGLQLMTFIRSSDNKIVVDRNVFIDLKSGVLDSRWEGRDRTIEGRVGRYIHLICADKMYHKIFIYFNKNNELDHDTEVSTCFDEDDHGRDTIGLGMDYDDARERAVCSSSSGVVSLLETYRADILRSWTSHENVEVWTVALCDDLVATGGDDGALKLFDTRENCTSASLMNRRSHTAGVTVCLFDSQDENILLTGSYDEHIRVFDIRSLNYPLYETSVGGGVWRLKWAQEELNEKYYASKCLDYYEGSNSFSGRILLSGECYGGGQTLLYKEDKLVTLNEFRPEDASMAYGIADYYFDDDKKDDVILSCHFYDKAIHAWSSF